MEQKSAEALKKLGRLSLVSIALTAVAAVVFVLVNRQFVALNGGGKTVDLQMGLSAQQVVAQIEAYTDAGRNYYRVFHTVDTFFPVIYGLAILITLAYLLRVAFPSAKRVSLLSLTALAAILSDLAENAVIDRNIALYPNLSMGLAQAATTLTTVKFASIFTLLIAAGVLSAAILIRGRKKPA